MSEVKIEDMDCKYYDSMPELKQWAGSRPWGLECTHMPTGKVAKCEHERTGHKARVWCQKELTRMIEEDKN